MSSLQSPVPTSIALLWMRMGPYHHARFRALRELKALRPRRAEVFGRPDGGLAPGESVRAIEVAAKDLYDWSPVRQEGVECLFPGRAYVDLAPGEIRAAVEAALNRLDPAVVGINGWSVPEARASLAWCRRKGRRAVLFSESLPPARGGRRCGRESAANGADCRLQIPGFGWLGEILKGGIVRQFDAALVGGRWHRDYVVRLGMAPERVALGYDVVDNMHFARAGGVPPAGGPAFVVNCRLIRRKNVDGILRAYAQYRGRVPDPWVLRISGSGPEEPALKSLAVSLRLDVDWCGFVQYPDLPALYAGAGAFIHAAHREPWGLVVNEACAAGLPLIVSRTVGATCELLEEGHNGWSFDPESVAQLADLMERVHRLPDAERQAMGQRSREIVSAWGPERFARGFVESLASRSESPEQEGVG